MLNILVMFSLFIYCAFSPQDQAEEESKPSESVSPKESKVPPSKAKVSTKL
jgi:hypothetical protein